jgi:hypothetical protein
VKKILYRQPGYQCTVISKHEFIERKSEIATEIEYTGSYPAHDFSLEMSGGNWRITWPNREGETFFASHIIEAIRRHNAAHGLTISYPATASCRTLIFTEETGRGFAFAAPPDTEGRVTEFCVNAADEKSASISIKGKSRSWFCLFFDDMKMLENKMAKLRESSAWVRLPMSTTDSSWQVQVGLIGPDGNTHVPDERGFSVLTDISNLMRKILGPNNVLHIFGYSHGHDTEYPDYAPSAILGGRSNLKRAIEGIHDNGQKAVFYMNGRIAQKGTVEKDGLYNAVLKDDVGTAFTEIYHDRTFYVMNPAVDEWQDRLFSEALALKELGADGIQLDQLGGRAAPVDPGERWGEGYIKLIDRIHHADLTVWMQGLSDIYPADWFELTSREINVLDDGTIRGGTPLGEPDKRLFLLSVPGQILLIPFSRLESREVIDDANTIIDLDHNPGDLFLYSLLYMKQLEAVMQKAMSLFKNNANGRVAAAL